MVTNPRPTVLSLTALLCLLVLHVPTLAQTASGKTTQAKASETETIVVSEADSAAAQRRTFAISLITALAYEARSYHDQALRPQVLARAADTLWNADSETARTLFRRAWEAAEKGDAEELTLKDQSGVPPGAAAMVTALRRISGRDLRSEVLNLAARRDHALGEEFLSKMKEATQREAAESRNDPGSRNSSDGWSVPDAVTKRFHLARKLLDDGDIERALEFVTPVLDQVNLNSISFLSELRGKRPDAADQRFAFLLARAEFDPSTDANTVSGLSSYAFTPGFYVTFSVDGGARWSQPDDGAYRQIPPNLPATLRNRFFQVAASILLRPLPPPDQDLTSSGRIGKYMVIKRLLPLFDQYAPDTAPALRSQLTALVGDGGTKAIGNDNPLLGQGIETTESANNSFDSMQERLDRAKTTLQRDSIYADAAAALLARGDLRAQDLADKIDGSEHRAQVRRYVDFELVRFALRKKDVPQVVRLAKAGPLNHLQRVWAYTQAARLLVNSDRTRTLQLLVDAADEARRINAGDPDRARSFTAVATQFVNADRVRSWELMGEAVKAANAAEKFTGENLELRLSVLATSSGLKLTSVDGHDFGLSGVLKSLAKQDLDRSIDLAKGFKNDAPRATAILAIAGAILEK